MKGTTKIYYRSLGCRVNLADLADVFDHLPADSYEVTTDSDHADLALINTCTVTHKADRDVRKIIGALERDHPWLPVFLTGCAVVSNPESLSAFRNVKTLLRPGDPAALAREIDSRFGPAGNNSTGTGDEEGPKTSPFYRLGKTRALVKIQDGCNARCAYCVLPNVRGRERSISPEEVMSRIEKLIAEGHREVVLCGIHLGRYGRGLPTAIDLAGLLERLSGYFEKLGAGYRIRLSSIEPLEWTSRLVDAIEALPFVCRHFHVPLQSGDDQVLAKMKRPYGSRKFAQIVDGLRERFPDAAIGTDVITGFPTESEAAAGNTLSLIRSLQIDYLHVFTYSARPGTPAADFPGRVETHRMRTRSAALRKLGVKRWIAFLEKALGRRHRVVVERESKGWLLGRSAAYRPFKISPEHAATNQLVEVQAKNLEEGRLVGVPCP